MPSRVWFWRPLVLFFLKQRYVAQCPVGAFTQKIIPIRILRAVSYWYVTCHDLIFKLIDFFVSIIKFVKLPKCSRSTERLYTFEFWLLTFSLKIIKINVYGSRKHSYYRYKPLSYMYLRYLINHTMYAISSIFIQCTSIKKKTRKHTKITCRLMILLSRSISDFQWLLR